MRHEIDSRNSFETIDLFLEPGETCFAVPNAIIAVFGEVESRSANRSTGYAKWWGSAASISTNEPPPLHEIACDDKPSVVRLAPIQPGAIMVWTITDETPIIADSRSVLAHSSDIEIRPASGSNLPRSTPRGYRPLEVSGEGDIYLGIAGRAIQATAIPAEKLKISLRSLVLFETKLSVEWPRGVRDSSGGLVQVEPRIVTFAGDGRVVYQTHGPLPRDSA